MGKTYSVELDGPWARPFRKGLRFLVGWRQFKALAARGWAFRVWL